MKIYVIIGRTGEYSDMNEWPVCWRSSLAEAEAVIAELQKQADEYKRWADADDDGDHYGKAGEQRRAAMLDPSFSCDYTGTTYHVWAVCEDPREDVQAAKAGSA